jgi:tetratricopeptide (TPR) repeat protein
LAEAVARAIVVAAGLGACVGLVRGQATGTGSARQVAEGLNFANGLFQKRNFALAAEEYERVLNSNPSVDDRNDARFGLANARLYQKRYQDAQLALRQFLAEAPDHRRARSAWYRLGEVSYLLGDLAESRRALERFTEGDATHPNLETAWTYLGDVRFALKDLPAAKRAYDTGLAAFPKGPLVDRARYGLGRSLAGLNQPDEALKILEDLARTGKRDWVDRARLHIGAIHHAAGRYDEAILAYKALERESPNSLLRP